MAGSSTIPRMTSRICLVLALLVCFSCPALAKKHKHNNGGGFLPILEVNALSITVDAGDQAHETFKIADSTQVTLNGTPSRADLLLAGMVAKITAAGDGETATSIEVKDAPRGRRK